MSEVTVARSWCASPLHKGPRWLHAMEFNTHARHKSGLQSYCRTCNRLLGRAEHMSARAKLLKNERSRRAKERQRRARGVARRNLIVPWFYPDKLAAYLDSLMTERVVRGAIELQLNGTPIRATDLRWLRRCREGGIKRPVPLKRADEICTRYDLQFWEMVEAAGRYRIDKRTRHRIAQMKREAA